MSTQWRVSSLLLAHPLHGSFAVHAYEGCATALRTWTVGKRIYSEWIGGASDDGRPHQFASIEAAQAACAAHAAMLDESVPVVCSALSDGFRCEQLEAAR